MRYLQETFDKIFLCQKTDAKTGEISYKHDGQKFEKIIEALLKEMFPHLKWIPTQTTNDGNKDFWANNQGETYWAECKNYVSSLELKVIAPTLVMAQLCNAHEIYFFSVSPINSNTKKKICYYSQINQKKVHFICDLVLENLLLQFQNTRAFFSHVKNLPFNEDTSLLPEQYILVMKNPFLNIITDDQILGQPIDQIKLNEIITEQVFVINNDIANNLDFSIKIDAQNEDLYCFEYLEEGFPSKIGEISEHFSIKPYEVFVKTFNFRVIVYKPELQLPSLQIIYANDANKEFDNSLRCVKCESIGRTSLVGDEYEDIKNTFETRLADTKRLFIFLCKGKSGVGKTRTLEEATALLMKNHYNILNFVGLEKENSFNIIREIVFVLYNITSDMLEDVLIQYGSSTIQQPLPTDISTSIKLLYALYRNENSIKEFLKQYGDIIYEKLSNDKYAIIIDNLQYFDEGILTFIKGIVTYSKNTNRQNSIVFCATINEDYLINNMPAQKLVYMFEKLDNISFIQFYSANISGFSPESALLFLKQLLKLKEETYDGYLGELVKKANYNPYNIKHYADCMSQNDTISSLENNQRIVHDQIAFIKVIDAIPQSLEASLNGRWQEMCSLKQYAHSSNCNVDKVKQKFLFILSCIHIFRSLTYQELLLLGCQRTYIKILANFHFIKCLNQGTHSAYVFDHDLIENFFERLDPHNLLGTVKKLKNKDLSDFEIDYPHAVHFIHLNTFTDINTLLGDIEYGISEELPYRLFLSFQKISLKQLLKNWEKFSDHNKCFYYSRKICITVRERMGGRYAHDFYKEIRNLINKYPVYEFITIDEFSKMLFDLCENYHHIGKYQDVIKMYNKYLPEYEAQYKIQENEKTLSIIAFIYNRLAIAYKHFPDQKSHKLRDDAIEQALNLSENLTNRQYYAESLYDKAAFYYNRIENKEIFIKLCEQSCKEVNDHKIELMYLHNIQRNIRLKFVRGERGDILRLIEEGLLYIENGEFNEYRFFFSKFFHTAKAMLFLLNGENYHEALQEILLSIQDTLSFGTTDMAYNYFLQAKAYFGLKEYSKSFESYKASYIAIQKSKLNEKEFMLELVFDDLKLKAQYFMYEDFSFLEAADNSSVCSVLLMTKQDYKKYKKKYRAKSIICSDDGTENYPCI